MKIILFFIVFILFIFSFSFVSQDVNLFEFKKVYFFINNVYIFEGFILSFKVYVVINGIFLNGCYCWD